MIREFFYAYESFIEITHFQYFYASFVVVFMSYGGTFLSARMEEDVKYNQDQSSIIIGIVTLKSIMYLTFPSVRVTSNCRHRPYIW